MQKRKRDGISLDVDFAEQSPLHMYADDVCVRVHVYAHVRANVFVCVPDCVYVFVDVCKCMRVRTRLSFYI